MADVIEEISGIKHLIAGVIQSKLQVACIDHVDDTASRADLVILRTATLSGKERIVLTVKHFDPMKQEGAGDATKADGNEAAYIFKGWPDKLIGGRIFETVRGLVELRCNFTRTRESAMEADRLAQLVLGRAKAAIRGGWGIRGLVDGFGEKCMDFAVVSGTEYDSGSDNSNTSRYFLRWAALTLTAPAQQGV
jgi:hypothetical protein